MELINQLKAISSAERMVELEVRDSDVVISGDFVGSVTASWSKLGERGEGIVIYNGKVYITNPLGTASLPTGAAVELSYANGVYYSDF